MAEISTMGYEVSFYYAGRKPTGCGYDTYGLNGKRETIPEAFKRLLHKDHTALEVIDHRCNLDFKYMPRGFAALDNTEEIFRCDVSQLAACSRMLTFKMLEHTAMKRMALSIVALHVSANIVDYYITKYLAKPMEQLQNLITQYALGLRRLEDEEAADQQATKTDPQVRARRVTIRLPMAANRSSWISATEAALFVHCGEGHFITHKEVPVFLSRVWYLMHECQRMLQGSRGTVLNAATVPITTLDYACTRVQILAITGKASLTHEPGAASVSMRQNEANGSTVPSSTHASMYDT